MNKKIRSMMREIERRGGAVGISDSLSDEVAEQFLREILSCPDCRASSHSPAETEFGDSVTIDKMLAGTGVARKGRGH